MTEKFEAVYAAEHIPYESSAIMSSSIVFLIREAAPGDLDAVQILLKNSGLPLDGIGDTLETMLVATTEEQIVGSAALEIHGEYALLRSVVVRSDVRGNGLGLRLTSEILELGARLGLRRIYLLTETAGDFFPRFGFEPVDRIEIPSIVKTSVEFTSACPESALAMVRSLGD